MTNQLPPVPDLLADPFGHYVCATLRIATDTELPLHERGEAYRDLVDAQARGLDDLESSLRQAVLDLLAAPPPELRRARGPRGAPQRTLDEAHTALAATYRLAVRRLGTAAAAQSLMAEVLGTEPRSLERWAAAYADLKVQRGDVLVVLAGDYWRRLAAHLPAG